MCVKSFGLVLFCLLTFMYFFFFCEPKTESQANILFFFSVCVMADGECRCVLFCLKENQLGFFFLLVDFIVFV